jgi:hypothetical protein
MRSKQGQAEGKMKRNDEVSPRIELGLTESKSAVITITLGNQWLIIVIM